MAVSCNRMIHGSFEYFIFSTFQPQRAAALTRIVTAIDRFSFRHFVTSLEGADLAALSFLALVIFGLEKRRQVAALQSLSRTLACGQLFGF
jgi:hypothetical protein